MPRDVELRIEIPEGEDKLVITDSVRLKQVVNNLINNAKKFTVTGSITFGYVTNREGYTTIFVEDTGSGISKTPRNISSNASTKKTALRRVPVWG